MDKEAKALTGIGIFFGTLFLGTTAAVVKTLLQKRKDRIAEANRSRDWILHNKDEVAKIAKQYGITAENFDKKTEELMSTMSNVLCKETASINMKKVKNMIRDNFDKNAEAFGVSEKVTKDSLLKSFTISSFETKNPEGKKPEFDVFFDPTGSKAADLSIIEGLEIFYTSKFRSKYQDLFDFQIIEPFCDSYEAASITCEIVPGKNFKAFKQVVVNG